MHSGYYTNVNSPLLLPDRCLCGPSPSDRPGRGLCFWPEFWQILTTGGWKSRTDAWFRQAGGEHTQTNTESTKVTTSHSTTLHCNMPINLERATILPRRHVIADWLVNLARAGDTSPLPSRPITAQLASGRGLTSVLLYNRGAGKKHGAQLNQDDNRTNRAGLIASLGQSEGCFARVQSRSRFCSRVSTENTHDQVRCNATLGSTLYFGQLRAYSILFYFKSSYTLRWQHGHPYILDSTFSETLIFWTPHFILDIYCELLKQIILHNVSISCDTMKSPFAMLFKWKLTVHQSNIKYTSAWVTSTPFYQDCLKIWLDSFNFLERP